MVPYLLGLLGLALGLLLNLLDGGLDLITRVSELVSDITSCAAKRKARVRLEMLEWSVAAGEAGSSAARSQGCRAHIGRTLASAVVRRGGELRQLTFLTTPGSFLAGAFFLVTPAGFLALRASVTFFLVLGLVLFLRVVAGAVSMMGKTRGLEWPVADRVPSRGIAAVDLWWCWFG